MPTAHLGGSGGMLPPENFENFDSLRVFLMHSGSSFFTRAFFCKHPAAELCCYHELIIVWACDKMGGSAPAPPQNELTKRTLTVLDLKKLQSRAIG